MLKDSPSTISASAPSFAAVSACSLPLCAKCSALQWECCPGSGCTVWQAHLLLLLTTFPSIWEWTHVTSVLVPALFLSSIIAMILFHSALAGVAILSLTLLLVSIWNLLTTAALSINMWVSVSLLCSLSTESNAADSAMKLSWAPSSLTLLLPLPSLPDATAWSSLTHPQPAFFSPSGPFSVDPSVYAY